MSEADDAPDMVQPVANPDAQTTVNDFLDYTEFFPSDLVRSLTLIGDLDSTYHDAVQQVHELTVLYGKLPALPEHERPDPTLLRKQIAQQLQTAINQREYALAEASRLYEVTVRHCQRSSVIKKKLQAQPQPPSRDPTPPPISPSAQRMPPRTYERAPHMRLPLDNGRHGANSSQLRDPHKKRTAPRIRGHSRGWSMSSESSGRDSDVHSAIEVATTPKKRRDRPSKPGRVRPPGVYGTNVHSSVAGISTSNALAQLAPPPPDARPGSKWAPWGKLTEYEMAVLRKQMKKNAVWEPSLTMVNRELERKHRTMADYHRELARCEKAGEDFLNEEPETLQQITTAMGVGQSAPQGPPVEDVSTPVETVKEHARENSGTVSIRLKPVLSQDGLRLDRLSQREQAERDIEELVDATEKIKEAAMSLKELTFSPHSATNAAQKRRTPARVSNKRKRDTSPQAATEGAAESLRGASVETQDSGPKAPEPKRARLQLTVTSPNVTVSPIATPTTAVSTPRDFPTPAAASSIPNTPVPLPEALKIPSNASTTQVPLAPAGPSTPKASKMASKASSRDASPAAPSSSKESPRAPTAPAPTQTALLQPAVTAASSRPRRESVAPKAASPPTASTQSVKASKASTPALESIPDAPLLATRPRSARGHVPTPKAQSEEPKPNEIGRVIRETRRHSIFGQSALTATPSTRMSSRKKAPPKGEIKATENGQKTVTNVKRSQGSKNRKKKEVEEEQDPGEAIGEDETRYCLCDDVSYGDMISCDNHVSKKLCMWFALANTWQCETEWFHMGCVNITVKEIPRRAKWYCPDCRKAMGVDRFGNPLVPPPLPGRRGR